MGHLHRLEDMTGHDDTEIWRRNLAPHSGSANNGLPLSDNRAPGADIAPWVARLVAAKTVAPEDNLISCGMCNDLVYTRFIINGRWTAESAKGRGIYKDEVLLFGQHSRVMPLTCMGDVMAAGIGLRAGALNALTDYTSAGMLDQVERVDIFGLGSPEFRDIFTDRHTPEDWNLAMEEAVRRFIAKHDPPPPDPVSAAFEVAAFADPAQNLSDFAEQQGISLRQLERVVKRDFGMTPKKVMRRARALDLAAQLLGVADDSETEEMMLRYFDQSHQIRDFSAFFGVTPQKFRQQPRPLLTINLEQRQARRLEELERIGPDGKPPWRRD